MVKPPSQDGRSNVCRKKLFLDGAKRDKQVREIDGTPSDAGGLMCNVVLSSFIFFIDMSLLKPLENFVIPIRVEPSFVNKVRKLDGLKVLHSRKEPSKSCVGWIKAGGSSELKKSVLSEVQS